MPSCGDEKAITSSGTTQLRSPCRRICSKSVESKEEGEYQPSSTALYMPCRQSTTVRGKSSGPMPASLNVRRLPR